MISQGGEDWLPVNCEESIISLGAIYEDLVTDITLFQAQGKSTNKNSHFGGGDGS